MFLISERHLHAEGYFILDDVAGGSNPSSPTTIRGIAQPGRARKISLSEYRRQSDSFYGRHTLQHGVTSTVNG